MHTPLLRYPYYVRALRCHVSGLGLVPHLVLRGEKTAPQDCCQWWINSRRILQNLPSPFCCCVPHAPAHLSQKPEQHFTCMDFGTVHRFTIVSTSHSYSCKGSGVLICSSEIRVRNQKSEMTEKYMKLPSQPSLFQEAESRHFLRGCDGTFTRTKPRASVVSELNYFFVSFKTGS